MLTDKVLENFGKLLKTYDDPKLRTLCRSVIDFVNTDDRDGAAIDDCASNAVAVLRDSDQFDDAAVFDACENLSELIAPGSKAEIAKQARQIRARGALTPAERDYAARTPRSKHIAFAIPPAIRQRINGASVQTRWQAALDRERNQPSTRDVAAAIRTHLQQLLVASSSTLLRAGLGHEVDAAQSALRNDAPREPESLHAVRARLQDAIHNARVAPRW